MSFLWSGVDVGCKPSSEEAVTLKANFEQNCRQAANALCEADVLLLVTGAGFSADSGLAVYADVAHVPAYEARDLDYHDICQPDWIHDEPDLFYGFWGQCFNDYRTTRPHKGYGILARWRDDKNKNMSNHVAQDIRQRVAKKVTLRRPFDEEIVVRHTPFPVTSGPARAFFSFTSNVDAHFYDYFEAHELYECHGNIELWQCSSPYCTSGIWRAPLDYSFLVDTNTMLAPPVKVTPSTTPPTPENSPQDNGESQTTAATAKKANSEAVVPHIGQTAGTGEPESLLKNMPNCEDTTSWILNDSDDDNNSEKAISNWPKCGYCQSLARPAILMFGDFKWKKDLSQNQRWNLWKEAVLDLCEARQQLNNNNKNPLKICIVEIGCGMTVPTSRGASERMVKDVQRRGGDAKLVRINPDLPLTSDETVSDCLIPIMSRGLRAIQKIDQIYREIST